MADAQAPSISIERAVVDSLKAPFRDIGLLAIAAADGVIGALISFFAVGNSINGILSSTLSAPSSGFIGSWLALIALFFVEALIGLFFLISIMLKAYYGKGMGVKAAMAAAIGRYPYVLATLILIGLAFAVPYFIIMLVGFLAPIVLALIIPYILLAVYGAIMVLLAIPFAAIGNKGPVDSIMSSINTMKGRWWGAFFSVIIVCIVYYIVYLVILLPFLIPTLSSFASIAASNATGAQHAGLVSSMLNKETSLYSSPAWLVAVVIMATLYSWIAVLPVFIYMQLRGQGKADAKDKARKAR